MIQYKHEKKTIHHKDDHSYDMFDLPIDTCTRVGLHFGI